MPRKGPAPKRELESDPIFGSVLVEKLTNNVMKGGRKSLAEKIVYETFDIIKDFINQCLHINSWYVISQSNYLLESYCRK